MEVELFGDAADIEALLGRDERDALAAPTGASRPADAVHVRLLVGRRVEVDHVGDVLQVEAAGRHVGGHEHVVRTRGEPAERPLSLRLRHAAVQGPNPEPLALEVPGEPVGPSLGSDEDQSQPALGCELAHQRGGLARVLHCDEAMHGVDDHRRFVDDLVKDGPVGEPSGQAADLAVEGRREQHRLPLRTEHLEDPGHVGEESHVEHPVGLVQDADADPIQAKKLAGREIEESAGGRDQDVGPASALGLRSDPDAAVDRRHLEVTDVRDDPELLRDLAGEFPRRDQDQGHRTPVVRCDPLDDRRGEREGLARARARASEDVAPRHRVGHDERLDREWLLDPPHRERADDRGRDAQGAKPPVEGAEWFRRRVPRRPHGLLHRSPLLLWFVGARRTAALPRDREPSGGGLAVLRGC